MTTQLKRSRLFAAGMSALAVAVVAGVASASGPLGVYGIVEKVVFEPDERNPQRVQVWGAFAYAEHRTPRLSPVTRGYLYFRLPEYGESPDTVRREWADLKAVAGTGQAVGFGSWGYIGAFDALRPDAARSRPPYILERVPSGGEYTDLRVRPASERPSSPAAYQTNTGVVTLSADGSHAALVRQLKDALKP
jgi:hypothetical protein